jgi:hypothetical protein
MALYPPVPARSVRGGAGGFAGTLCGIPRMDVRADEGGGKLDRAGSLADAVLYEGYLLYPYRRSSAKNRVRWQFGVLAPRPWIAEHGWDDGGVAGSVESWYQQVECLVDATPRVTLRVRLRFLQSQRKRVETAEHVEVPRLDVDGDVHVSFDEAMPRQAEVTASLAELRNGASVTGEVVCAGTEEAVPILDGAGAHRGRIVRSSVPVRALLTLRAAPPHPAPLTRIQVRVENTATLMPESREEALQHALLSTHTVLAVDGGGFVSLLDPPEGAREAVRACRNVHAFPVLLGDPGSSDVMLAAPIILYDHPKVAPESPGDLFDATEIDEILSLRTLTLTDEEKREARATDPRAAAIVDRVESMPPEVMERLHGAIRSLHPVATDAPAERVVRGSVVRLRPRSQGADPHDMFLSGRSARVENILDDYDGSRHVVVSLLDDPLDDIGPHYGRLRHFRPDEVEPL